MVSINGNLGLPRKVNFGNSNNQPNNNETDSTTTSSSSSSSQRTELVQATSSIDSGTFLANRGITINEPKPIDDVNGIGGVMCNKYIVVDNDVDFGNAVLNMGDEDRIRYKDKEYFIQYVDGQKTLAWTLWTD